MIDAGMLPLRIIKNKSRVLSKGSRLPEEEECQDLGFAELA